MDGALLPWGGPGVGRAPTLRLRLAAPLGGLLPWGGPAVGKAPTLRLRLAAPHGGLLPWGGPAAKEAILVAPRDASPECPVHGYWFCCVRPGWFADAGVLHAAAGRPLEVALFGVAGDCRLPARHRPALAWLGAAGAGRFVRHHRALRDLVRDVPDGVPAGAAVRDGPGHECAPADGRHRADPDDGHRGGGGMYGGGGFCRQRRIVARPGGLPAVGRHRGHHG